MVGGAEEEQQNFVTQEQLLQLVKDFNTQLTDNMNSIQASIVAEVVKALKASGAAGTHEEELDETDEEYAARLQREEQARRNAHGRGVVEEEVVIAAEIGDQDTFKLHRNNKFHPRRNINNDQLNEEKFVKLKFSMPKFEGTSDPDAYLTWELNVDKIFRVHNYSEEKKVHIAALDFDGYALIWWEQIQNQREKNDELPVTTWAEMKREMRARFVPKHYKRELFDKLQNLKQGSNPWHVLSPI
ncbi:hypothetical protein PAHAL_9G218700 [Panicum hallii]|uniref:Retrotransposon gag domain-containing protein n=1 Tax=Panicum hallii TaxID=206008 RepID=A0A2T8I209_9POAL|nr:hypothetical protein PAHAL_9G218700 [Panicum hallii]